ncbi:MAG: hypothetical protein P4L50_20705 [Anaerolineaceae bacterium]|nr:hypothetical protein [Anaerolineaceae bacterium]
MVTCIHIFLAGSMPTNAGNNTQQNSQADCHFLAYFHGNARTCG